MQGMAFSQTEIHVSLPLVLAQDMEPGTAGWGQGGTGAARRRGAQFWGRWGFADRCAITRAKSPRYRWRGPQPVPARYILGVRAVLKRCPRPKGFWCH